MHPLIINSDRNPINQFVTVWILGSAYFKTATYFWQPMLAPAIGQIIECSFFFPLDLLFETRRLSTPAQLPVRRLQLATKTSAHSKLYAHFYSKWTIIHIFWKFRPTKTLSLICNSVKLGLLPLIDSQSFYGFLQPDLAVPAGQTTECRSSALLLPPPFMLRQNVNVCWQQQTTQLIIHEHDFHLNYTCRK